jgi:hypothetical protein
MPSGSHCEKDIRRSTSDTQHKPFSMNKILFFLIRVVGSVERCELLRETRIEMGKRWEK